MKKSMLAEIRADQQTSLSTGDERIALSEIVSALSFALDLTEGAVPGHAVRSCLLGMRIGRALGLGETQLGDLYYALLLKDIGCSSNAARMCQILGGDEREVKREVKTVDWTRPSSPASRCFGRMRCPEQAAREEYNTWYGSASIRIAITPR
jgi:hypothetical protein